jgi:hypothetical protein
VFQRTFAFVGAAADISALAGVEIGFAWVRLFLAPGMTAFSLPLDDRAKAATRCYENHCAKLPIDFDCAAVGAR